MLINKLAGIYFIIVSIILTMLFEYDSEDKRLKLIFSIFLNGLLFGIGLILLSDT